MRYSVLFFCVLITVSFYGQIPAKRYRWKQLGPIVTPPSNTDVGKSTAVGLGWVQDVLITDNDWYAGSMTGGLYRSSNSGKKWKKVDDDTLQLGTLCLLNVGDTIFRGTGLTHYDEDFGVGLLYSVNRGRTWNPTGLQFSPLDKQPLWDVDADKNGNMLACTPNEIYVSTDASKTWKRVYRDETCDFKEVHIDMSGNLWVCGNKLLFSSDGHSWQDKTSALSSTMQLGRVSISQDAQNLKKFLAFYGEKDRGVIDQSYDGGQTWKRLYDSRKVSRADIHHTEIAIAPNDSNVVVLGTYRAYISTDGGKTFAVSTTPHLNAANFAHDDIRDMQVNGSDDIYLATDGGVFHSSDSGQTWINKTGKGLAITQIYGMHQLADKSLVMGCQDLGYFHYTNKKWEHLGRYYGDGGDAIETSQGLNILLGGRLRSIDINNPRGSKNIHPPTRTNPFVAKLIHYPDASDTFFYVGNDVWKYSNGLKLNLTKKLDGKKEYVSGFNINSSNPQQLLMSYDQPTWKADKLVGKFYKSIDGGETWKDITANLPILAWRYISGITTRSDKPDEIVVSLGIMDDDDVYKAFKSTDGGISWTNYSDGLPPYQTFGVWRIANTSGLLLASIEGLYYRNDRMEAWQKLSGKIPSVAIRDIVVDEKNRKIYAATYGSGMWFLKLPRKMLKF